MKTKYIFLSAILAAIAGGCAVGPDYHQPKTETPAQWSEPLQGGETNPRQRSRGGKTSTTRN